MTEFVHNTVKMEMIDYPVATLPDYLLESQHFQNWREIFPNETIFPYYNNIIAPNLEIKSQEDIDKIIECDALFLMSSKFRIEILRNIDRYWREDPNSSQLCLPQKDKSWFANQTRSLFDNKTSFMTMMHCMKQNYVDLFEYIYDRDGPDSLQSDNPFCVFPLLYYAIINNNIEILYRGIERGCYLCSDLFEPAIQKKNVEIVNILIKNEVRLSNRVANYAVEHATHEILCILLDKYIADINKYCFVDKNEEILFKVIHNFDNLKELFLNRSLRFENPSYWANVLLWECITKVASVDAIQFLEEYFSLSLKELRDNNKTEYKYIYIPDMVVKKDNLDLYTYLRKSGFLVKESLIAESINNICLKITPGLVRSHFRNDTQSNQSNQNNE